MNARVGLLALALLLASPWALAADPGKQPTDLATVGAVSSVAVADSRDQVAAAGADPGSTTIGQDADADVWYLWNADRAVIQHGSADRTNCDESPPDNCKSPAVALALNDAGSRLVVISQITRLANSDETLLVAATETQGEVFRTTLPGVPVDIAMDAAGSTLAVLTTDKPSTILPDTNGRVFLFDWGTGSAVTSLWTANLTDPAVDLALSRDGQRVAAVNSQVHWYTRDSGTATVGALTGTDAEVVSFGPGSPHRSLVGFDEGDLALYSDTSRQTPLHRLQYGGGNTAVTSLAMTRSGSLAAAGFSDGTIRLFTITASSDTLARVGTDPRPTSTAVGHLAFSGDGRYLVSASGSTLAFFTASSSGLQELWRATTASPVSSVAVDLQGERVVAGVASAVQVYAAVHSVASALSASVPNVAPGSDHTATVRFQNNGNRPESIQLGLEFPTGWFASVDAASFDLAAGASRDVSVRIVVPALQAPGTYGVFANHSLGSQRIDVPVPTVNDLLIDMVGSPGADIQPGQTLERTVTVTNRGNVARTVTPTVGATSGWTVDLDPDSDSIAPGQSKDFALSLTAPSGAGRGDTSTASVSLPGFPDQVVRFSATVGAVFGVNVESKAGVTVLPGGNATLSVDVRNAGNTPDDITVRITGTQPAGWRVLFDDGSDRQTLDAVSPGAVRTLNVRIEAPAGAADGTTATFGVQATSTSDGTKSSARQVVATVEVPTTSTDPSKKDNGIPGPGLVLVAVALSLVALRRRRE